MGVVRLEERISNDDKHVMEITIRQDPIYLVANQKNMDQAHIRVFHEILVKTSNPQKI